MILLLVSIIVGLSYAMQATFGFGAGLVSLPFLSLLIGAKTGIGVNLIFQTLTGALLFTTYKHISFTHLPVFLVCILIGTVLGTLFAGYVDERILELVLGCYLVFYGWQHLWQRKRPELRAIADFKKSNFYAALCGFPGGLIGGAFGSSGPMLAAYVKSLSLNKESIRATILFVTLYCNTIRIVMSWHTNQFDDAVFHYVLYAAPLFLLGLLGGNIIFKRLNEKQFHNAINIILLLAGITLLIRHFVVIS